MLTRCPNCGYRLPAYRPAWRFEAAYLVTLIALMFAIAIQIVRGLSFPRALAAVLGSTACIAAGSFVVTLAVPYVRKDEQPDEGEEGAAPAGFEATVPEPRIQVRERTRSSMSANARPVPPPCVHEVHLWMWLRAVARDMCSVSETTARDYGVITVRAEYRALFRWLVEAGLYITRRADPYDNGSSGDLTPWAVQLARPTEAPAPPFADELPRVTNGRTGEISGWGAEQAC